MLLDLPHMDLLLRPLPLPLSLLPFPLLAVCGTYDVHYKAHINSLGIPPP
uniref:Uncharacterized protein n=1 Tax=Picea glauca TaxID=3330 RepID=A0A101M0Q1_PICGL|nr:hypothetical protein ABT39_MTgene4175 [Picea glauca]QHR91134.1 hypothetical protein Q903MT_gene5166 [Picea sitchensis]